MTTADNPSGPPQILSFCPHGRRHSVRPISSQPPWDRLAMDPGAGPGTSAVESFTKPNCRHTKHAIAGHIQPPTAQFAVQITNSPPLRHCSSSHHTKQSRHAPNPPKGMYAANAEIPCPPPPAPLPLHQRSSSHNTKQPIHYRHSPYTSYKKTTLLTQGLTLFLVLVMSACIS